MLICRKKEIDIISNVGKQTYVSSKFQFLHAMVCVSWRKLMQLGYSNLVLWYNSDFTCERPRFKSDSGYLDFYLNAPAKETFSLDIGIFFSN